MTKLAALFSLLCLQASICFSQVASVRVDLSQPGKKVSPGQFGIFFEEINHAGDGGLYKECHSRCWGQRLAPRRT